MKKRTRIKYIHEGHYVAEVDVELVESEEGWSPYLSLDQALRLDDIRAALRRGDLKTASSFARIYAMTPVAL
ncbi:MAG: hypothetical protein HY788_09485 [Deltaproteobacteria bacterium]|nr:hypothetical protein [Deltaproteobacteria bacterium]